MDQNENRQLAIELVKLWIEHLKKINELRQKYPLQTIKSNDSYLDNAFRIIGFPPYKAEQEQEPLCTPKNQCNRSNQQPASEERILCNASLLSLRESNLTADYWESDRVEMSRFDSPEEYVDWLYERKKAMFE